MHLGVRAAGRMRLPAGGFHEAFQRGAAGLLQQGKHLGRLAALAFMRTNQVADGRTIPERQCRGGPEAGRLGLVGSVRMTSIT